MDLISNDSFMRRIIAIIFLDSSPRSLNMTHSVEIFTENVK
tara:strand:- start:8262 stop:8384 length:123 start_codon:yes stop_codon:yes gene_type:complete